MRRGVGLWSHMQAPLSLELSACRNQKVEPHIYEEHHTHRAHRWRHRRRRCASTNSVSNSPSTETFTAGFNAKKPQNPKQQTVCNGLSASSRHTGMIKGRVSTSVE